MIKWIKWLSVMAGVAGGVLFCAGTFYDQFDGVSFGVGVFAGVMALHFALMIHSVS